MKSNCWRQPLIKRNTSPRNGTHLSVPSFLRHCLMKAWWSRSASTLITESQPRESSSSEMLPVPENKSNAEGNVEMPPLVYACDYAHASLG